MDIFDVMQKTSKSFVSISAEESGAFCESLAANSWADWAVVERCRPGYDNLYYVIMMMDLLDELNKHGRGSDARLVDILDLHESDSNSVIRSDGRVIHPKFGFQPKASNKGRFGSAAVLVEGGVPAGIFIPVSPGGTRGINTFGPGPAERSLADAEEFVDCTLGAEFPGSLVVGDIKDLEIQLAAGILELTRQQAVVRLSPNDDVVLRLSLSSNLKLHAGKETLTIKVPTDSDDTRVLLYQIKAIEAGQAQITIRLFQPGRSIEQIGFLQLRPTVTKVPIQDVAPLQASAVAYPPSGCPAPDLLLLIEEQQDQNKVTFRFFLTDAENCGDYDHHFCGEKTLNVDPAKFFRQTFSQIETTKLVDDNDLKEMDFYLRQQGRQLYADLFSQEVRNELQRRADRIVSIQVKTNGQHIPWEMVMMPAGNGDEFLGSRYQLTRWTEGFRAPSEINIKNFSYTVPNYQTGRLRHADAEVDYIKSLSRHGIQPKAVVPQTWPVCSELTDEDFGVFHYVGHAIQVQREFAESELQLETEPYVENGLQKQKEHRLRPTHLNNLGAKWGARRPLIFFNACQTGLGDVALVGLGGWANRVLASRAGAFVGTLWSVQDSAAQLFSKAFYDALVAKKTFGEAALLARRTVAANNDPSWLAYVVYAHPNARVTIK